MKSQVLTLLLLTIGAHLFQSTHQYRLRKRELTEYDLTNFIVSSCSADKVDIFIQNLCDQTLQSALMGNFPFLLYYCKAIDSGSRYCENINRYTLAVQNAGSKRYLSRRFVRSLFNEDDPSYQKESDLDTNADLEQNLIVQICMTKTDKDSHETHRFCNRTLERIQQGQYPEIRHLCKIYGESGYCRDVLSLSSVSSRPSSIVSSSLSSSATRRDLTSVPLVMSPSSDVESILDQPTSNSNSKQISSS